MRRIVLAAALLLGVGLSAPVRGDENMSGQKQLNMDHCPSAVPGATTHVTDIDAGVVVTVRAPRDPMAQLEIRRRVQFQLEIVDRPERSAIEHTGLGTGSGRYGFCPGMREHTSLEVVWLGDGARMTVRADRAEDVRRLQTTTHKRARALQVRARALAAK